MEKTTYVNSPSEFPNWKSPCPKCGAKYPQPAISARKDGSAAWCKSCGWNWKIGNATGGAPQGWTKPEPSTEPKTDNGFKIMSDEFINLKNKIEELIQEIRNNIMGQ